MRNSWKIFSLFCLAGAILLVAVPQIWIVVSAFRQDGGAFTIQLRQGEMMLVSEDVQRFIPRTDGQEDITLERPDGFAASVSNKGDNRIVFKTSGPLTIDPSSAGSRLVLNSDNASFVVEQTVPMSIFGTPTAPVFEARPVDGAVEITHAARSFIRFHDRALSFSFGNFKEFLSRSVYLEAIKNSLIVTIASTVLASIVAVPLAWLVARYSFYGRSMLIALITMASISPPFLGAYVWRMLLGSNGLLTAALGLDWTIVGLHGVIWVIIWLIYPLIFLMSLDSFSSIDPTLRESALSLGATRRRAFFNVEIPTSLPGVLTGLYMAAMAAFSDFGTPFIISLDLVILPKLVYTQFLNETGGNVSIASTGSIIMLIIAMMFLAMQRVVLAGRSFASVTSRKSELDRPGTALKWLIYGFGAIVIGFAFTPHVFVAITSFLEWRAGTVTTVMTLANYSTLFTEQLNAVWVSLSTAFAATMLCMVFGLSIAYMIVRKRFRIIGPALNGLVMTPYIIPGTVFAIGFILAFNQGPIVLTGTWFILVLSYFVRMLPFSLKTSEAALYQIHPAVEDAAMSLGATPVRVFLGIVVPMMLSGAITGLTLVFLHSATELSSTILLYRPPWTPMSAVIFQNTISPGANFGYAAAMSVLMMVILYVPLAYITCSRKKTLV
ncbi:iron ABC transporter permease [Pseudovibrio sp. SPO723]|uniref:ABC transporter permease n=1 Tax=Nesiotobacter zosterae TaxID=392721 RepID=UPI0029C29462|nr:iron ABC transporter permease [Pseudovibrio sp. SPO723]MDX5594316.1 iron ABC transporter permease [Pseudovibrio sp. SPO723]